MEQNEKIQELESQIAVLSIKAAKWDEFWSDMQISLPRYEEKLNYKVGGKMSDRILHVLQQFETTTNTAVYKAKDFIDDVKTQFKALEMVVEGISYDGYNHTQKRVIANHVINLLRNMVQTINQLDFNYSDGIYNRYDFFRSTTPEKELYRKYNELKFELEQLKKQPVPDIKPESYIPF